MKTELIHTSMLEYNRYGRNDPPWTVYMGDAVPDTDARILLKFIERVRHDYSQEHYALLREAFRTTGFYYCAFVVQDVLVTTYSRNVTTGTGVLRITPPDKHTFTQSVVFATPRQSDTIAIIDIGAYVFEGFNIGPFVPYEQIPVIVAASQADASTLIKHAYEPIYGSRVSADITALKKFHR